MCSFAVIEVQPPPLPSSLRRDTGPPLGELSTLIDCLKFRQTDLQMNESD